MKRSGCILLTLLGLNACIVIGAVFVLFSDFMFVTCMSRRLAYALAPPEYPGSQLVKTYRRVGTESMGDWRTFRTTDDITKVLAFLEQHMPGFVAESDPYRGTIYLNFREDRSDLAKKAADYACSSLFCRTFDARTYPSVTVILYADSDNSSTLIEILIDYPAP